jgi:endonuclease-3
MSKKKQALAILNILKQLYPDATCSLNHENTLQLLIATILSAQCTDKRVNQVTPALFKRFPDAKSFAEANPEELETLIRPTGFYRNKAKNIQKACETIVQEFDGNVPQTMKELLTLSGVARKTANVVLAHGFGIIEGVTVDTHVKRISRKLGLTKESNPVKIEQDLMKILPKTDWENFSITIIYHGRAICKARKPQCSLCKLHELCPSKLNI